MQETLFDVHGPVRSPLRYPGGKTRVAKRFAPYFPEHTHYREIFAGGGAIFFYKPKAETNWINDLHPGLYAFWVAVRDRLEEFAELCRAQGTPGSKKRFHYWAFERRDLMTCRGRNHLLERAVQFYYLNRTVWGGRVVFDPDRKSRLYFSNPQGWARLEKKLAHLRRVSAKLQGGRITCRDYAECLAGADASTFIYADPPYYRESTGHATDKLYDKSFDIECHARMARELRDCPAKVMISYDDCPEVRELYEGWRFEEMEWTYCGTYAVSKEDKANGRKEEKVTGQELLILNYEV
ncbi:MAG: DNA adenine methylase [Planctomycetota bacterium]